MVVPEKVSTDTKLYEEPVYFSIDVKDLKANLFAAPCKLGRLFFKCVSTVKVGDRVLIFKRNSFELVHIKSHLQLENISVESIFGTFVHFEAIP